MGGAVVREREDFMQKEEGGGVLEREESLAMAERYGSSVPEVCQTVVWQQCARR